MPLFALCFPLGTCRQCDFDVWLSLSVVQGTRGTRGMSPLAAEGSSKAGLCRNIRGGDSHKTDKSSWRRRRTTFASRGAKLPPLVIGVASGLIFLSSCVWCSGGIYTSVNVRTASCTSSLLSVLVMCGDCTIGRRGVFAGAHPRADLLPIEAVGVSGDTWWISLRAITAGLWSRSDCRNHSNSSPRYGRQQEDD